MAGSSKNEKKGHVCPPSDATHPSDRWETLFVYSFICKFTNLRGKIEGLETPMDLENALLSNEPNDILSRMLAQFILNLKPHTRNLSEDQISTTVASVLAEYFKTPERTVFWDEELKANVDPFDGLDGGFFGADWDFKLKILRQLVELQLTHSTEVKAVIDRAWGVVHNKHKKKDAANAPPDPTDPKSQESLQLLPIGQDCQRKRYWVVDESPRLYVSTNPWKITATLRAISSTREEYISAIEQLKSSAPPDLKKGQRRTKPEQAHITLIAALEGRIEAIDAELARVQRVRRKLEQKRALLAQAELRETRTRRRTQRPDYVYDDIGSEDDADEYKYEDDAYEEVEDDDFLNFRTDGASGSKKRRGRPPGEQRRSTRTAALNANNKREGSSDSWQWRGERRSTRLGGIPDGAEESEPPYKRARTEDSTASGSSVDAITSVKTYNNRLHVKATGAAALKPTEVALEEIAGKKRSKFWVYAVEPIPGAGPVPAGSGTDANTLMEVDKVKDEGERGHHKADGDSDQTSASSEQVATPEPPEKMGGIEATKGGMEVRIPLLGSG